jgi:hypothetical protein
MVAKNKGVVSWLAFFDAVRNGNVGKKQAEIHTEEFYSTPLLLYQNQTSDRG